MYRGGDEFADHPQRSDRGQPGETGLQHWSIHDKTGPAHRVQLRKSNTPNARAGHFRVDELGKTGDVPQVVAPRKGLGAPHSDVHSAAQFRRCAEQMDHGEFASAHYKLRLVALPPPFPGAARDGAESKGKP